jgi:hypothetical protein
VGEESIGIIIMKLREKTSVTKSCELLLDAFQFVEIGSRNRVPNNGGVFKL